MQRLTDTDVIKAIANAQGLGQAGQFEVPAATTVTLKYIRDTSVTYAVLTSPDWPEPIVFRLAVQRQPKSKPEVRTEAQQMLDEYIANGRQITTVEPGARTYSSHDMKRKALGLKVATKEEVEQERNRRALIALKNKDHALVLKLMTGGFDRVIKHDLENDRIGPNGEIRNPVANPGRNAAEGI